MKKLITLSLALVLVFALSACGGNGGAPSGGDSTATPPANSSATPTPDNSTPSAPPPAGSTPPPADDPTPSPDSGGIPDGQAMASLIQWMKDGTFSYDFTMISEGPDGRTEGSGSMAIDGEDLAMRQAMTVEGQSVASRIIKKGGKLYMIDDESKTIMEMPVEMNLTEGIMTDYSGIVKIGEGTGEIDGKTLPYEEYTEDSAGTTVRYFLDSGEVYGMVSEAEGYKTTMIIQNPSGSVPSGAFDLPADYTDMGSLGGGFNLGDYLPD